MKKKCFLYGFVLTLLYFGPIFSMKNNRNYNPPGYKEFVDIDTQTGTVTFKPTFDPIFIRNLTLKENEKEEWTTLENKKQAYTINLCKDLIYCCLFIEFYKFLIQNKPLTNFLIKWYQEESLQIKITLDHFIRTLIEKYYTSLILKLRNYKNYHYFFVALFKMEQLEKNFSLEQFLTTEYIKNILIKDLISLLFQCGLTMFAQQKFTESLNQNESLITHYNQICSLDYFNLKEKISPSETDNISELLADFNKKSQAPVHSEFNKITYHLTTQVDIVDKNLNSMEKRVWKSLLAKHSDVISKALLIKTISAHKKNITKMA
ncbi:MAG: hypothetical protein V1855_00540, partial [bacterium]